MENLNENWNWNWINRCSWNKTETWK